MRTQFSKLALTVVFGFALAFTFSCSSGGGGGGNGGWDNPGGGGVPFNENSQIYNMDGTLYKGSGIIKIDKGEILINAGSVTNGIVKLELPRTIPDEWLGNYFYDSDSGSNSDEDEQPSCTDFPTDIKAFGEDDFKLFNGNGERIGKLKIEYSDEQIKEGIVYIYFSKAGKITCDYKGIHSINAKIGWNKIYVHKSLNSTREYSTNNILTKELKWHLK